MLEWREAAAAATVLATATKGVLFEELEAEVVAAEVVKLRAVRTTPRPATDENTVLLAI